MICLSFTTIVALVATFLLLAVRIEVAHAQSVTTAYVNSAERPISLLLFSAADSYAPDTLPGVIYLFRSGPSLASSEVSGQRAIVSRSTSTGDMRQVVIVVVPSGSIPAATAELKTEAEVLASSYTRVNLGNTYCQSPVVTDLTDYNSYVLATLSMSSPTAANLNSSSPSVLLKASLRGTGASYPYYVRPALDGTTGESIIVADFGTSSTFASSAIYRVYQTGTVVVSGSSASSVPSSGVILGHVVATTAGDVGFTPMRRLYYVTADQMIYSSATITSTRVVTDTATFWNAAYAGIVNTTSGSGDGGSDGSLYNNATITVKGELGYAASKSIGSLNLGLSRVPTGMVDTSVKTLTSAGLPDSGVGLKPSRLYRIRVPLTQGSLSGDATEGNHQHFAERYLVPTAPTDATYSDLRSVVDIPFYQQPSSTSQLTLQQLVIGTETSVADLSEDAMAAATFSGELWNCPMLGSNTMAFTRLVNATSGGGVAVPYSDSFVDEAALLAASPFYYSPASGFGTFKKLIVYYYGQERSCFLFYPSPLPLSGSSDSALNSTATVPKAGAVPSVTEALAASRQLSSATNFIANSSYAATAADIESPRLLRDAATVPTGFRLNLAYSLLRDFDGTIVGNNTIFDTTLPVGANSVTTALANTGSNQRAYSAGLTWLAPASVAQAYTTGTLKSLEALALTATTPSNTNDKSNGYFANLPFVATDSVQLDYEQNDQRFLRGPFSSTSTVQTIMNSSMVYSLEAKDMDRTLPTPQLDNARLRWSWSDTAGTSTAKLDILRVEVVVPFVEGFVGVGFGGPSLLGDIADAAIRMFPKEALTDGYSTGSYTNSFSAAAGTSTPTFSGYFVLAYRSATNSRQLCLRQYYVDPSTAVITDVSASNPIGLSNASISKTRTATILRFSRLAVVTAAARLAAGISSTSTSINVNKSTGILSNIRLFARRTPVASTTTGFCTANLGSFLSGDSSTISVNSLVVSWDGASVAPLVASSLASSAANSAFAQSLGMSSISVMYSGSSSANMRRLFSAQADNTSIVDVAGTAVFDISTNRSIAPGSGSYSFTSAIKLEWSINYSTPYPKTGDWITFTITTPSSFSGWLGIGIGSTQLSSADVLTVYRHPVTQVVVVDDRKAIGSLTPSLIPRDYQQDVQLVSYDSTTIVVRRRMNTFDNYTSAQAIARTQLTPQTYTFNYNNGFCDGERVIYMSSIENGPTFSRDSFTQSAILYTFRRVGTLAAIAQQSDIIDVMPGQIGYSDLWRVITVLVPTSFVGPEIRYKYDIPKSWNTTEDSSSAVARLNCPVVHPNSGASIDTTTNFPIPATQSVTDYVAPRNVWYRGAQFKCLQFNTTINAVSDKTNEVYFIRQQGTNTTIDVIFKYAPTKSYVVATTTTTTTTSTTTSTATSTTSTTSRTTNTDVNATTTVDNETTSEPSTFSTFSTTTSAPETTSSTTAPTSQQVLFSPFAKVFYVDAPIGYVTGAYRSVSQIKDAQLTIIDSGAFRNFPVIVNKSFSLPSLSAAPVVLSDLYRNYERRKVLYSDSSTGESVELLWTYSPGDYSNTLKVLLATYGMRGYAAIGFSNSSYSQMAGADMVLGYINSATTAGCVRVLKSDFPASAPSATPATLEIRSQQILSPTTDIVGLLFERDFTGNAQVSARIPTVAEGHTSRVLFATSRSFISSSCDFTDYTPFTHGTSPHGSVTIDWQDSDALNPLYSAISTTAPATTATSSSSGGSSATYNPLADGTSNDVLNQQTIRYTNVYFRKQTRKMYCADTATSTNLKSLGASSATHMLDGEYNAASPSSAPAAAKYNSNLPPAAYILYNASNTTQILLQSDGISPIPMIISDFPGGSAAYTGLWALYSVFIPANATALAAATTTVLTSVQSLNNFTDRKLTAIINCPIVNGLTTLEGDGLSSVYQVQRIPMWLDGQALTCLDFGVITAVRNLSTAAGTPTAPLTSAAGVSLDGSGSPSSIASASKYHYFPTGAFRISKMYNITLPEVSTGGALTGGSARPLIIDDAETPFRRLANISINPVSGTLYDSVETLPWSAFTTGNAVTDTARIYNCFLLPKVKRPAASASVSSSSNLRASVLTTTSTVSNSSTSYVARFPNVTRVTTTVTAIVNGTNVTTQTFVNVTSFYNATVTNLTITTVITATTVNTALWELDEGTLDIVNLPTGSLSASTGFFNGRTVQFVKFDGSASASGSSVVYPQAINQRGFAVADHLIGIAPPTPISQFVGFTKEYSVTASTTLSATTSSTLYQTFNSTQRVTTTVTNTQQVNKNTIYGSALPFLTFERPFDERGVPAAFVLKRGTMANDTDFQKPFIVGVGPGMPRYSQIWRLVVVDASALPNTSATSMFTSISNFTNSSSSYATYPTPFFLNCPVIGTGASFAASGYSIKEESLYISGQRMRCANFGIWSAESIVPRETIRIVNNLSSSPASCVSSSRCTTVLRASSSYSIQGILPQLDEALFSSGQGIVAVGSSPIASSNFDLVASASPLNISTRYNPEYYSVSKSTALFSSFAQSPMDFGFVLSGRDSQNSTTSSATSAAISGIRSGLPVAYSLQSSTGNAISGSDVFEVVPGKAGYSPFMIEYIAKLQTSVAVTTVRSATSLLPSSSFVQTSFKVWNMLVTDIGAASAFSFTSATRGSVVAYTSLSLPSLVGQSFTANTITQPTLLIRNPFGGSNDDISFSAGPLRTNVTDLSSKPPSAPNMPVVLVFRRGLTIDSDLVTSQPMVLTAAPNSNVYSATSGSSGYNDAMTVVIVRVPRNYTGAIVKNDNFYQNTALLPTNWVLNTSTGLVAQFYTHVNETYSLASQIPRVFPSTSVALWPDYFSSSLSLSTNTATAAALLTNLVSSVQFSCPLTDAYYSGTAVTGLYCGTFVPSTSSTTSATSIASPVVTSYSPSTSSTSTTTELSAASPTGSFVVSTTASTASNPNLISSSVPTLIDCYAAGRKGRCFNLTTSQTARQRTRLERFDPSMSAKIFLFRKGPTPYSASGIVQSDTSLPSALTFTGLDVLPPVIEIPSSGLTATARADALRGVFASSIDNIDTFEVVVVNVDGGSVSSYPESTAHLKSASAVRAMAEANNWPMLSTGLVMVGALAFVSSMSQFTSGMTSLALNVPLVYYEGTSFGLAVAATGDTVDLVSGIAARKSAAVAVLKVDGSFSHYILDEEPATVIGRHNSIRDVFTWQLSSSALYSQLSAASVISPETSPFTSFSALMASSYASSVARATTVSATLSGSPTINMTYHVYIDSIPLHPEVSLPPARDYTRRQGWYKGQMVHYYHFEDDTKNPTAATNSNLNAALSPSGRNIANPSGASPIIYVRTVSGSTVLTTNTASYPIIESLPGVAGYNDLHSIYYLDLPSTYTGPWPTTIAAVEALVASGTAKALSFSGETRVMPVVNSASTVQTVDQYQTVTNPTGVIKMFAYYETNLLAVLDFGAVLVPYASTSSSNNLFYTFQRNDATGSNITTNSIFNSAPAYDVNTYHPVRQEVLVTVTNDYAQDSIADATTLTSTTSTFVSSIVTVTGKRFIAPIVGYSSNYVTQIYDDFVIPMSGNVTTALSWALGTVTRDTTTDSSAFLTLNAPLSTGIANINFVTGATDQTTTSAIERVDGQRQLLLGDTMRMTWEVQPARYTSPISLLARRSFDSASSSKTGSGSEISDKDVIAQHDSAKGLWLARLAGSQQLDVEDEKDASSSARRSLFSPQTVSDTQSLEYDPSELEIIITITSLLPNYWSAIGFSRSGGGMADSDIIMVTRGTTAASGANSAVQTYVNILDMYAPAGTYATPLVDANQDAVIVSSEALDSTGRYSVTIARRLVTADSLASGSGYDVTLTEGYMDVIWAQGPFSSTASTTLAGMQMHTVRGSGSVDLMSGTAYYSMTTTSQVEYAWMLPVLISIIIVILVSALLVRYVFKPISILYTRPFARFALSGSHVRDMANTNLIRNSNKNARNNDPSVVYQQKNGITNNASSLKKVSTSARRQYYLPFWLVDLTAAELIILVLMLVATIVWIVGWSLNFKSKNNSAGAMRAIGYGAQLLFFCFFIPTFRANPMMTIFFRVSFHRIYHWFQILGGLTIFFGFIHGLGMIILSGTVGNKTAIGEKRPTGGAWATGVIAFVLLVCLFLLSLKLRNKTGKRFIGTRLHQLLQPFLSLFLIICLAIHAPLSTLTGLIPTFLFLIWDFGSRVKDRRTREVFIRSYGQIGCGHGKPIGSVEVVQNQVQSQMSKDPRNNTHVTVRPFSINENRSLALELQIESHWRRHYLWSFAKAFVPLPGQFIFLRFENAEVRNHPVYVHLESQRRLFLSHEEEKTKLQQEIIQRNAENAEDEAYINDPAIANNPEEIAKRQERVEVHRHNQDVERAEAKYRLKIKDQSDIRSKARAASSFPMTDGFGIPLCISSRVSQDPESDYATCTVHLKSLAPHGGQLTSQLFLLAMRDPSKLAAEREATLLHQEQASDEEDAKDEQEFQQTVMSGKLNTQQIDMEGRHRRQRHETYRQRRVARRHNAEQLKTAIVDEKKTLLDLRMSLEGPYGGIQLPLQHYETLVLCVGGIGMTSAMSLLEAMTFDPSYFTSQTTLKTVVVVWVCRYKEDLNLFASELFDVLTAARKFDVFVHLYASSGEDASAANLGITTTSGASLAALGAQKPQLAITERPTNAANNGISDHSRAQISNGNRSASLTQPMPPTSSSGPTAAGTESISVSPPRPPRGLPKRAAERKKAMQSTATDITMINNSDNNFAGAAAAAEEVELDPFEGDYYHQQEDRSGNLGLDIREDDRTMEATPLQQRRREYHSVDDHDAARGRAAPAGTHNYYIDAYAHPRGSAFEPELEVATDEEDFIADADEVDGSADEETFPQERVRGGNNYRPHQNGTNGWNSNKNTPNRPVGADGVFGNPQLRHHIQYQDPSNFSHVEGHIELDIRSEGPTPQKIQQNAAHNNSYLSDYSALNTSAAPFGPGTDEVQFNHNNSVKGGGLLAGDTATTKSTAHPLFSAVPILSGRPNWLQLLTKIQSSASDRGENRVAVHVNGPIFQRNEVSHFNATENKNGYVTAHDSFARDVLFAANAVERSTQGEFRFDIEIEKYQ